MAKSLILKVGTDLVVEFRRFVDDAYPRIDGDLTPNNTTYTFTGGISGTGYPFDKAIFDVNVFCTPEQKKVLNRIAVWHFDKVAAKEQANILVFDTTQQAEERVARTRAIVPDTVIETEVKNAETWFSYYAQFYCWMKKKPRYFYRGKDQVVNFSLTEADKVAP